LARRSVVATKREEFIRHAFVLNYESLDKLDVKIKQYVGSPHYAADCSDGVARKFPDAKKFKDYENLSNKAVEKLRIVSIDIQRSRTIIMTLQNNARVPIFLYLDMPEEPHDKLYSSVTEILFSMKPWYSRLATLNIIVILWLLLTFFFAIRSIYMFSMLPPFDVVEFGQQLRQLNAGEMLEILFEILLHTAPVIVILVILDKLIFPLIERAWKYIFPTAMFNVGQGATRFENGEYIRKGVVISLLISIVASAIVVTGQLILVP
jgi:hypothetical protein